MALELTDLPPLTLSFGERAESPTEEDPVADGGSDEVGEGDESCRFSSDGFQLGISIRRRASAVPSALWARCSLWLKLAVSSQLPVVNPCPARVYPRPWAFHRNPSIVRISLDTERWPPYHIYATIRMVSQLNSESQIINGRSSIINPKGDGWRPVKRRSSPTAGTQAGPRCPDRPIMQTRRLRQKS